jgi:hypothetical protein
MYLLDAKFSPDNGQFQAQHLKTILCAAIRPYCGWLPMHRVIQFPKFTPVMFNDPLQTCHRVLATIH